MTQDDENTIPVDLPPEILKSLDAWIAEQPVLFTRAEAVRAIVGATLDLIGRPPAGQ